MHLDDQAPLPDTHRDDPRKAEDALPRGDETPAVIASGHEVLPDNSKLSLSQQTEERQGAREKACQVCQQKLNAYYYRYSPGLLFFVCSLLPGSEHMLRLW